MPTTKTGRPHAHEKNVRSGERIAKVIARSGLTSRREAERMIESQRVTVNGKKINSAALNVTKTDKITVDGNAIESPPSPRLWLFHKPIGLISTTKDEQGRKTIFDALPTNFPHVLNVGRLDLNSEGLLLLTNDVDIKRHLELPSTGWLRRYRVRVKGQPTEKLIAPLRTGITLGGERFRPMEIPSDRQQRTNAWLTISLREGKNREHRRAMEHIGLKVNRLIRISYGPFQLGTLKVGTVEEVRQKVMRNQLELDTV